MGLTEDGLCVRIPGRDYGDAPQAGRMDEVTAPDAAEKAAAAKVPAIQLAPAFPPGALR